MEILGRNIKRIYKKWGLDQALFSDLMESTRGRISQYVIGASDPKISFLIRLQELTRINCADLYQRDLKMIEIPPEPLKEDETGHTSTQINDPQKKYLTESEQMDQQKMIKTVEEIQRRMDKLEGKD